MKKVILIGLLAAVPFGFGFAGTQREELMKRMGFSKEEIAKDAAAHEDVNGTLKAIPGKSDPATAASLLREANEINKLRQTEGLAAETERRAALAKIKQQEAEEKAEAIRLQARRIGLANHYNGQIYADALDVSDRLEHEAKESREAAQEQIRKAEQARASANAAIAKVKADEAKLDQKRLTGAK